MKSDQFIRKIIAAKSLAQTFHFPLHGGAIAVFLAQHCPGLLAEEMPRASGPIATSAAQAAVPWMSGGVSEEARGAMRSATPAYNLHVVIGTARASTKLNFIGKGE